MPPKIQEIIDAIDERTGLPTGIKHFLFEEIPASSGWHQIFGSVAMFLILVQFFTGAMLALNYAPTPGDAYESVRYIMKDVTGGALMRGLHHWGASMVIVLVVLHMCQVAIWGAYKKPREGTWIVGCVLLLLTLAFGLSGYLLSWDNRAYWGTMVTTKITATAPLAGPYLTRLLGGGGDTISVVTFARFFTAHVMLLPPLTLLLIVFHVILVRKHGVAPAPGDETKPKKMFFPEQVFKDTVAVFIAFAVLFTLAVAVRVPIEHMADPTDTSYLPRPEWYFLFLFQTLKMFEGPLEIVGTMILPTLAILGLILVPFIDRSKLVHVRQRVVAMGVVLLCAAGWGGLTLAAVRSTPEQTEAAKIDYSGPTDWMKLTSSQMAGVQVFRDAKCASCHATSADAAATSGPNLIKTVSKRDNADWLAAHVKEKYAAATDSQVKSVSALMGVLKGQSEDHVASAPNFAALGGAVYEKNNCGACHQLNNVGGKIGPPMNGLVKRRTEAWVRDHFNNPAKLSPGSIMPPYKFTDDEMKAEISYLMTLPDSVQ